MSSPHDLSAATIVPCAVERLPLYHWRPGSNLLGVGSRDGASFDGDPIAAERGSFQRPLQAEVLRSLLAKTGAAGICASWCEPLLHPRGLALLATCTETLVIASPGRGDTGLLADLLPRCAAWLLLVDSEPGPLAERILAEGRHVEVLLGLDERAWPRRLPWERARAIHCCARIPREVPRLDAWVAEFRAAFPHAVPVYDPTRPHSDCRGCGGRLVWRVPGRIRLEGLDVERGVCRLCGTAW